MRLFFTLLFVTTIFSNLYSQEKFSNLISAFDNHNYVQVDSLLVETRTEVNSLNVTQFKLFELISLFRKDNLLENEIDIYHQNIKYFLSKSENVMPVFINNLSSKIISSYDLISKNKNNIIFKDLILKRRDLLNSLLKRSIEIEKKDQNQSHYLSVVNLYDSYNFLSMIEFDNREKFKKKLQLINHYNLNKDELSFINNNSIYQHYVTAFYSVINDADFINSFDDLKEIVREFISLKKKLDNNKYVFDEYFESIIHKVTTTLDDRSSMIQMINSLIDKDYYPFQHYLTSYYLEPSLKNYEIIIDHIVDNKKKLSYWEVGALMSSYFYTLVPNIYEEMQYYSEIKNDFLYKIYSKIFYNLEFFNLGQIYNGIIISNINLLSKYYDGDLIYDDVFKYPNLFDDNEVLHFQNLEKKFKENFNDLSWYDHLDLFDYKVENSKIDTENINNNIKDIFARFNENQNYLDTLLLIDGFLSRIISLISLVSEDLKDSADQELIDFENFISENFIKNNNQIEEIDLKIKLSSNVTELIQLKNNVEKLYSDSKYKEDKYGNLLTNIDIKIFDLNQSLETAIDLVENITLSNPIRKVSNKQLTKLLNTTVDYNIKNIIPTLSNFILETDLSILNNKEKYSFQVSLAKFYKYIGKYEESLLFFLQARANPWHWDFSTHTIQYDLNKEFIILENLIDLSLKTKREDDVLSYINNFQKKIEDSKLLIENFPQFNIDIIKYEKIITGLSFRYYNRINELEKANNILTKFMYNTELSSFERFTYEKLILINKLKESTSKLDNYIDNDFQNELNQLYETYKQEKDEFYYTYVNNTIESFNFKINKLIVSYNSSIDLLNKLSFDNQLPLIKDLFDKFKLIEFYVSEYNQSDSLKHVYKSLAELLINLDSIDTYNTKLLQLDESIQEKYFELRFKKISDTKNIQKNKAEFDVFEQKVKSNFPSQVYFSLDQFLNNFKINESYVRISKVLKGKESNKYLMYIFSKDKFQTILLDEYDLDKVYAYYKNQINIEFEDNQSYKYFFKPVIDLVENKTNVIYVKNDGLYNNVNLESLYDENTNKYLIDLYDIRYIEKTNSIFNKQNIEIKNAFLFGNPNFGNGSSSSKLRSGLNQLTNTKIEVEEINQILLKNSIKAISTDMNSSTEENLYMNSSSDIIHIATHGFFDEKRDTGFNFGLFATNAKETMKNDFSNNYKNDGIIYGNEIYFKNFTKTDLVVLSACETGVGETNYLGTLNLTNSFIRAGAKNVISTLWEVDDKVTKDFMIMFYSELMKDFNISKSLRDTKFMIRNKYKNPKYWAGFVLTQNLIY